VREGTLPCRARTQSALAVSSDYRHWFLVNASPDIRLQIETFAPLRPQGPIRETPVQAVVLTDAELDHTIGLLSLRETRVLRLYATEWVHTALSVWNPLLRTLRAYCEIDQQPIRAGETVSLHGVDGVNRGLQCQAFATGGAKAVAFAPPGTPPPDATIGYRFTDTRTGQSLVYAPGVQELNTDVRKQLRDCACVFFDGTCWEDDELPRLGISSKTSRAMGHVPISGPDGSLEPLAALKIRRKVYIHINNTNPVLIDNSPQRRAVEGRGIEIAFDGMEIEI
jgi:pyrroloquinoline quinone biosynthesis protein B